MSDETFASSGDAERIVRLASDLISAGQPEGLEGPRATVLARALRHPRIRVLVDPVLPGRPNVIAVVAGDGDGPGLLLNAHLDTGHPEHGWRGNPLEPWVENGRTVAVHTADCEPDRTVTCATKHTGGGKVSTLPTMMFCG